MVFLLLEKGYLEPLYVQESFLFGNFLQDYWNKPNILYNLLSQYLLFQTHYTSEPIKQNPVQTQPHYLILLSQHVDIT